jgi:hypothetical protein
MRIAAAAGVAIAATGTAAASVAFARKTTEISSKRRDDLPILSWADGLVELAATPATLAPGQYSLYTAAGTGHARIGKIVSSTATTVIREVEAVYRPAPAGVIRGYWSGYAYEKPSDVGLPSTEVDISVSHGSAPAWMIPGSGDDVWTLHIHGLGGRRAACIRSAPVFETLGHTQLVVSYTGDRDAPEPLDGRHHFGLEEWTDVDAALHFAVANGARRVVLSAWSMGATIALQLLKHSDLRELIAGAVLTAPVLDWRPILTQQGAAAGLPPFIPPLGLSVLESRLLHRLAGVSGPLDLSAASWFAAPAVELPPILVLHSPADPMAPFALSERWAAENDADLRPMESPGHTLEWSARRAECEQAVLEWACEHLKPAQRDLGSGGFLTEGRAKPFWS